MTDEPTFDSLLQMRAQQQRLDALDLEIAELRGFSGALYHPSSYVPAAFELLEYMVSQSEVSVSNGAGVYECWIRTRRETMEYGKADTLAEAIALACRDALKAVKEAKGE